MKKLILLLFLSIIIMSPLGVRALSVDKNNLTIEKGSSKTIDIYANVEEEVTKIDFTLVYSTYDIPAYFNVESGLTDENPDGISHSIVFSEPVTGNIKLGTIKINVVNNPKELTGTVNIHTGTATTTSDEKITLNSQIINVKIGVEEENTTSEDNNNSSQTETKEVSKSMLLEKIESNIVKINLKEGVYEYTVNFKKDIEELDLKPIVKDEKYQVDITTQKISDLENNQIIITVKDGDNTEIYKIKVNILETDKVEIDDETFKPTYKYKGKWITLIIILSVALFIGLGLNRKK